jgi:hypothetical protein
MTQEEKNLLLQDLCARLPYGVHIHSYCQFDQNGVSPLYSLRERKGEIRINDVYYIDEVKPYLFPLSSMTEEQKSQYSFFLTRIIDGYDSSLLINWLNKNHFDYRGLIPMGLAEDATGLNVY